MIKNTDIKTSSRGFCFVANHPTINTISLPSCLLNGSVKKRYDLSDKANELLINILSNKNTDLNHIQKNDYIYYKKHSNIVNKNSFDKYIQELLSKGFIDIKQNETANQANHGLYINYDKAIELINNFIKELIDHENKTDREEKIIKHMFIPPVIKNTYFNNLNEFITLKDGKNRRYFTNHENDILETLDQEAISIIPSIPEVLEYNLDFINTMKQKNTSPIIFFFNKKNYPTMKMEFEIWKASQMEAVYYEEVEPPDNEDPYDGFGDDLDEYLDEIPPDGFGDDLDEYLDEIPPDGFGDNLDEYLDKIPDDSLDEGLDEYLD